MEIEPISLASSTSGRERSLDLWARALRARTGTRGPAATETFQPDPASPDGVELEYAEHEGTGARMVRMVDADTGQVISELPHHQVLDLVAELMQQNQERGGDSDAQH